MPRLIVALLVFALLTWACGAAGMVAVPPFAPEIMGAFTLILVLLRLIAVSDQKRF